MKFPRAIGGVIVWMLLASTASASDGVLEINQTCAVETGCFPGDLPGFPVHLGPGSYRLTSTLVAPADVDGIKIVSGADGTVLDLGGFSILGPISCSYLLPPGFGVSCFGSTTGSGIYSEALGARILNGSIRGFQNGIRIRTLGTTVPPPANLIREMALFRNAGDGVHGWADVEASYAFQNGGDGFDLDLGSGIWNSSARENSGAGVRLRGIGTSARDLQVIQNGGTGIEAGDGALVTGSQSSENNGAGIIVGKGSTVSHNVAFNNIGDGIIANSSTSVSGNTMRSNNGFGLFFRGSQSNYRGNTISSNGGGTVGFGPGNSAVDTGQNACDGSTTCP